MTALMELMADLRVVLNESKFVGVEEQLDQQVIIRDLVMANRFYEKEAKKTKKDKRFKFKFQDLINKVADRAQVLKLQGMNMAKGQVQQMAKVAVIANGPQGSFRDVLRDSPPKQQGALPVKPATMQAKCRFCLQSHQTEAYSRLLAMSQQQRLEALKRAGFCFRCLKKGHVAK